MAKKTKAGKDPYNEENPDFRTRLSRTMTKETVAAMRNLGCPTRIAYLHIALKMANKQYGPNVTS